MIRSAILDAAHKDAFVKRLGYIFDYAKELKKLEKSLQDNGFKVDLEKGQLDPAMSKLFPNSGVNVLEEASKLLADNPWKIMISIPKDEDIRALWKAAIAFQTINRLLSKTVLAFREIAPQPSEEEINTFQTAVALEDCEDGTYFLFSGGAISCSNEDGTRTPCTSYLYHCPRFVFPHPINKITFARLKSLEVATTFRNRMKEMMERALEADQEREERRKK